MDEAQKQEKLGLVSVIVPCYNQGKYLSEALDSVIAQTYKLWECIIIDDGSIDNTKEVAQEYCKKDTRIRYLYQENQGVVAARNNAIKQSSGKYILPLDGDDLIVKDYLQLAVNILDKNEEIGLVYCDVERFGADNCIWYSPEMNIRNILFSGCCACTSMFRRKSFDIVGGFKKEMNQGWEDWEFFISLMETGCKAYKIHMPLLKYRIMENSRERSIKKMTGCELRASIVKLHPILYYEQYKALLGDYYAIVKSRKYKFVSFLGRLIGR